MGKQCLALVGEAMLSKSLIQKVGLCSLHPLHRGNGGNGDLLQKGLCQHCCSQYPDPAADHCPLTPSLETWGYSQASLAWSLVW